DPIGKRLKRGSPETPTPWMTVVGEIGDIRQIAADANTRDQFYVPANQADVIHGQGGSIVLRSALPSEQMVDSLRAVVRSIDPQLPLTQVESMEQVVAEGQASRRF